MAKEYDTTDHTAFIHRTPPSTTKMMKRRPKLQGSDLLDIAWRVIVAKEYQAAVARRYRISTSYVSQIGKRVERNPKLFREMQSRRD